ncbi:MAG: 3-deoxy-8-phosphooctulonate synthase [Phycisphaerales bacterium]|nr:MAG: 3-deoxy-8-phosphooctulonate synthase [Phycisphaerales bacterium]
MTETCRVGNLSIGGQSPLTVIAGPCVLEDPATNDQIAQHLRETCRSLELSFIFKASFDKANRSSGRSPRGPGLDDGLQELARLRATFDVPVTTDVHETSQAAPAAAVVDLLQVPAFLVRQTDLLIACAETGKPVNAKKGQFMAPKEMQHVLSKLREAGAKDIMLTERGTFFGYHRLVNDFIGLGDLMELGAPVCFDVTHSTQLPGGGDGVTAGRPDRAALLARAAVAAGAPAIFIECHPEPAKARSDASTMQSLDAVTAILRSVRAIHEAMRTAETSMSV